METITTKLEKLNEAKEAIKAAIQEKGVPISDSDSFKSYADRVRLIQGNSEGGVRILRAFVPADFKGSTALNSTILLNPASYYSKAEEEFSHTPYGIYYDFLRTLHCTDKMIVASGYQSRVRLFSLDAENTMRFEQELFRNGDWGSNAIYYHNKIFFTPYYDSNFFIMSYDDYNKKIYVKSVGVEDKALYRSYASCGQLLIFIKENEVLFPAINSSANIMIKRFDLKNEVFISTHYFNPFIKNYMILPLSIYKNEFGIFVLFSDFKIGKVESGVSDWAEKPLDLKDVKTAIQFYNGKKALFVDSEGMLRVLSLVDKGETVTWEEDLKASSLIQNAIGRTNSGSFSFKVEESKAFHIMNDGKLYSFEYDEQTDSFSEVLNPCNVLKKNDSERIFEFAINKEQGVCAVLIGEYNSLQLRYAKFVKTDLGDLSWIAYEPSKANYTTKSITGTSLNITGTDEKGNNYVDVRALLPSNDLGDYLPKNEQE